MNLIISWWNFDTLLSGIEQSYSHDYLFRSCRNPPTPIPRYLFDTVLLIFLIPNSPLYVYFHLVQISIFKLKRNTIGILNLGRKTILLFPRQRVKKKVLNRAAGKQIFLFFQCTSLKLLRSYSTSIVLIESALVVNLKLLHSLKLSHTSCYHVLNICAFLYSKVKQILDYLLLTFPISPLLIFLAKRVTFLRAFPFIFVQRKCDHMVTKALFL